MTPENSGYINSRQNNDEFYGQNSNENNYYNGDSGFDNQPGRSAESSISSGEFSDQHMIQTDQTVGQSATLSRVIVDKFAVLNRIVAQAHRSNNNNLLEMQNPLLVKNTVVKVTKQNFVNFQNVELQNLENGNLEYLSINPEKNYVYAECTFDKLVANGNFKTNLAHTKSGQFTVEMNYIRSNVSAMVHRRGKAIIRPAKLGMASTHVNAEHLQDTDSISGAVDKKYRSVLEQAISNEVHNATHKGMVAQLKTEMNVPLDAFSNGHAIKLYDMDWTENDLKIQMASVDGLSWKQADQKIDSMSYTRENNGSYKMRVELNLNGLKWTSDLTAEHSGRRAQSQSLGFNAKNIRVRLVVFKSVENDECRKIETDVKVKGLTYNFTQHFPAKMQSAVESKLPQFIQKSLEAHMNNLLKQQVCGNRMNAERRMFL